MAPDVLHCLSLHPHNHQQNTHKSSSRLGFRHNSEHFKQKMLYYLILFVQNFKKIYVQLGLELGNTSVM